MTHYRTVDEDNYGERLARARRRSRYDRPRSTVMWTALLFGMILGLAGGLYYAWVIAPVENTDVAPWQLESDRDVNELLPDRDAYMIAIMMAYRFDGDLATTVQHLVDLRLPGNDPIQYVADTACRLARNGYVDSNSRRNAIRSMMIFYQRQGKTGCADQLIAMEPMQGPGVQEVLVLPTPTLIPPATKTPSPEGTAQPFATTGPSGVGATPQAAAVRSFDIVAINAFCSTVLPGLIEVRVQDRSGQEIPGMPVRVRSPEESSTFYTGLKPERGPGYADYEMTPGSAYIIEIPGLSDPSTTPLSAAPCSDDRTGDPSVQSYRVIFRGG
ncbi:MAG: hypothetical protein ACOCX3_01270 [Chloroflexota bacterium]